MKLWQIFNLLAILLFLSSLIYNQHRKPGTRPNWSLWIGGAVFLLFSLVLK